MTKNEEAIRKWIANNRPDLAWRVDQVINDKASFLLLSIGFEAGRQYQHTKFAKYIATKANENFHMQTRTYPSNTLDEVRMGMIGMLENDY